MYPKTNRIVSAAPPPQETETQMTDDEKIERAAARILREYRQAFEELAK